MLALSRARRGARRSMRPCGTAWRSWSSGSTRPRPETSKAAEEALIKLGPRVLPLLPELVEGRRRRAREAAGAGPRRAPGRGRSDEPGGLEGHDPGEGRAALRGPPAAPGAVGQRHHRPPRAGGGRGDQPRARPGPGRRPLLRGAGPGRRQGRGHAQLLHRRRHDRPDAGQARREAPLVQFSGPFRIAFKQVAAVRDLQAGTATANAAVRGGLGAPAPPDAPEAQGRGAGGGRRPGQAGRAAGHERVDRRRAPAREPGRRAEPQPGRPRPRGAEAGLGEGEGRGDRPGGAADLPLPQPGRRRTSSGSRGTSA